MPFERRKGDVSVTKMDYVPMTDHQVAHWFLNLSEDDFAFLMEAMTRFDHATLLGMMRATGYFRERQGAQVPYQRERSDG